MWQRQQTLYLLISAALVLAMCFGTAYRVTDPDGLTAVSYWQLQKPYFGILLGILTGLVLLALVTFKSLILQMRLSSLGGIIALGMEGWLAWMYFTFKGPVYLGEIAGGKLYIAHYNAETESYDDGEFYATLSPSGITISGHGYYIEGGQYEGDQGTDTTKMTK